MKYYISKFFDVIDKINRIDIHYNGKNVAFLTHHPGANGDYQYIERFRNETS